MIRRGTAIIRAGALLVFAAVFQGVIAAEAEYEGQVIRAVRFDPPSQPLQAGELHRKVGVQAGDMYHATAIRQAIENLYGSGRFIDIVVEAETVPEGGVEITFRTVNRWFVGGQQVEGVAEPPSQTQLINISRLRLGEEFTDAALAQALENLKNLLNKNGLYEASVTADVERDTETQQAKVMFQVDAGRRARFADPIISGDTSRTQDDIIRASGWKRWWGLGPYRLVTESRVESGIQRIRRSLEKKDLLMSKVDLAGMEWKPDLGVAVPSIEVVDGPRVDVDVEGYKIAKRTQRTLLPIFQERSVDNELLNEGSRQLQAYLYGKGFFDAKVHFDQNEENDTRFIRYFVDRGPRYKLTSLDIAGNEYFSDATLRERMSVTPATRIRYPRGRFSQQLFEADASAITSLYRSNGFLNVKVETDVSASASGKEQSQTASVVVEEGPQFVVDAITIRGVDEDTAAAILERMQMDEGQPYSEQVIAIDRETILNIYFDQGYTEATFDWQAERMPNNRIAIGIDINEGPQRFVNRVLVDGIKATDPKLVYDRISLKPGDPLSLGEMLESQKRLYDLGIFARVNTAIQNPSGDERFKYVLFELEESKKYSYNIGVGAQVGRIGTGSVQNFDSPAGSTGFSPRLNAGITRSNLMGLGHSATIQGRLSNIQKRAQATYLAPHFRDQDDLSLAISTLYDDSRDVRTFAATRVEAAIQLTRRLSRANTVQGRYILRRVSVDPDSLKIQPLLIPLLAQPVRLGIAAATFIQDRRDDPIESRKGFYNSIDAGLALGALGSQSDFGRILARNSSYHEIAKDLIFARSVTFGFQDRLRGGPLNDIPLPERFFAGGSSSHRGFPENQAGPRDRETGFPIGGKALLMFNHELRYPIYGDNLGAVLFHDMGNVFSNIGSLSFRFNQRDLQDFDYSVQAVGLGFRYRTPIGPVRIDLAYSINSPRFIGFEGTREELLFGGGHRTLTRINQFQFHFSLGQTF